MGTRLLRCCLLIGLLLSAMLPPIVEATPKAAPLVAIYILAYDNRLDSTMNLTPYYDATLTSITNATVGQPDLTAIVLADLAGMNDTHVRVVQNGNVNTLIGLPDLDGIIDSNLKEYDVTDGKTLGGFLLWVKSSYAGQNYTLSYIGHGVPIMPDIEISTLSQPERPASSVNLPPLPTRIGANADVTDHTLTTSISGYNALSPNDLALALAIAAPVGPRLAVLDVLMCFGGSVEALYPLAPYAEYLTASPNYAFFDPTMPGNALFGLNSNPNPLQMAQHILNSYHNQLPSSDHPRILSVIDADQLNNLKTTWDSASNAIYANLLNPSQREVTRTALFNAYLESRKYDLSYCEPSDWELNAPDGLVDLRSFAHGLSQSFANLNPQVASFAAQTRDRIRNSSGNPMVVVYRLVDNDFPWFDPTPTQWIFDGPNQLGIDDDAAGLSLYADLQGLPVAGATELSWQAHWYHDDDTQLDNPHPLAFLADMTHRNGWDEVFQEYWRDIEVQTALCTPSLPAARDQAMPRADISLSQFNPADSNLAVNESIRLSVMLNVSRVVQRSDLCFEVVLNGTVVFSDSLMLTKLEAGSQRIYAQKIWQPTTAGVYSLRVVGDGGQHVQESNENNNVLTRVLNIAPTVPRRPMLNATTLNNLQLSNSPTVTLNVQQQAGSGTAVSRLTIQAYQYQGNAANPRFQTPVLRATTTINQPNLPTVRLSFAGLDPGAVVLYVWGYSSNGYSLIPAIVRLNYAPLPATISQNQKHIYRFSLERDQSQAFRLQSQLGNSNLHAWEPYIWTAPTQQSTSLGLDQISYNPTPLAGEYIVQVSSSDTSRYLFTAIPNPPAGRNLETITSKQPRPIFEEPNPFLPTDQMFIPVVQR